MARIKKKFLRKSESMRNAFLKKWILSQLQFTKIERG